MVQWEGILKLGRRIHGGEWELGFGHLRRLKKKMKLVDVFLSPYAIYTPLRIS